MSVLLHSLYTKYNIYQLSQGAITDALGDVYEDFVEGIFKDLPTMKSWPKGSLEELIVRGLFDYLSNYGTNIKSISSSRRGIPLTINGGSPKTDVYLTIYLVGNPSPIIVPLNVKQSTVSRVSFAEYDVNTIANVLGIIDPQLIFLLNKHQADGSAKYFTQAERDYLRTHLNPYAISLVRWCITLSPIPVSQDIRYPEYVIRFDLHHPKDSGLLANQYKNFNIYSIDEYIRKIMFNNSGNPRTGGFGTGLSWTYATGSKGMKIQFKA